MEELRRNIEEIKEKAAVKRSYHNPDAFDSSEELILRSLPPLGCKFLPSDRFLITGFLMRKIKNQALQAGTLFWDLHANIYTYNPLHLAKHHEVQELEAMFFFVPKKLQKNQQKRKEANIFVKENRRKTGVREPLGFWRSDGSITPIIQKDKGIIGLKKTFIFYGNETTDWMMDEYRVIVSNIKLDDWILVKLYMNDIDKNDDPDTYIYTHSQSDSDTHSYSDSDSS